MKSAIRVFTPLTDRSRPEAPQVYPGINPIVPNADIINNQDECKQQTEICGVNAHSVQGPSKGRRIMGVGWPRRLDRHFPVLSGGNDGKNRHS